MIAVGMTVDVSGARAGLQRKERAIDTAASRAINKTAGTARKQTIPVIVEAYGGGIRAGQVRAREKVKDSTRATLEAVIRFSGRRIQMYGQFGMRGRGRRGFGVAFSKLPWKVESIEGEEVGRDMLARAFRNRIRGGRAAALARWGRARKPITVLVAPGLAETVVARGVLKRLAAISRARFPVVFDRELAFATRK